MANANNFPDQLTSLQDQRPSRVSQKDVSLIQRERTDGTPAEKSIVFGQTERDLIELYVYDDLGRIINHINIRPNDEAMRLLTFAQDGTAIGSGQDNTPDNVQVDLVKVLTRLNDGAGLSPGRYSVSLNFFRDEVGKEFVDDAAGESDRKSGSKLYIADISPSRTELRLGVVKDTPEMLNAVREFVDPSVPRFAAQGVVDQTFGTALEIQQGEAITLALVETKADEIDDQSGIVGSLTVTNKLQRAALTEAFASFVGVSLPTIRDRILDDLASRVNDLDIQGAELQQMIAESTNAVLTELVRMGQLHPKLQLVDPSGRPVK